MVYVVERYLPGLSHSDLLRGLSRLEQLRGDAGRVRYLGSTIVLADDACYCQFEGPTEAAIAEANRQAGLSFDRIVPVLTVSSERSTTMHVSTTIPASFEIRRGRLVGLLVGVAAVAAALTWAVSSAVDTGGTPARASAPSSTVTSLAIPPTGYLDAVRSSWVRSVTSMTPVQLIEAFGTDARTAAALASLTPKERISVESIITSTPAQLRAAFGTSSR